MSEQPNNPSDSPIQSEESKAGITSISAENQGKRGSQPCFYPRGKTCHTIERHFPFDKILAEVFKKHSADGTCFECGGPLEVTPTEGICRGTCDEKKKKKRVWNILAVEEGCYPIEIIIRLAAHLHIVIQPDNSTVKAKEYQKKAVTAALTYAARGWHVLPAHSVTEEGKCSCNGKRACKAGKHPRTQNGSLDATIDKKKILEWWSKWPDANVAVATGPQSGIEVLDVDPDHGGQETLADLEATLGPLPRTPIQVTGSGGLHYILRCLPENGGLSSSQGTLGAGIDTRGRGGYIVVEPSRNIKGNYYWDVGFHPDDTAPAPLPQNWLDEFNRRKAIPTNPETENQIQGTRTDINLILSGVPEGQRDSNIYNYAWDRFAKRISVAEVTNLVIAAAAKCTPEPFTREEALAKVENAAQRYAAQHPSWTDPTYSPPASPMCAPPGISQAREIITAAINEMPQKRALAVREQVVAAAQVVEDEDPELYVEWMHVLRKNSLVKLYEKERRKRRIRVVEKGEKPISTVISLLQKSGIPVPRNAEDLIMPGTYIIDEYGIGLMGLNQDGVLERSDIAPAPILPVRIFVDMAEGKEHVEIAFLRNNSWRYVKVDRQTAVDSRLVGSLSNFGAPTPSHLCKMISRYVSDFLETNTDTLVIERLSPSMGWIDFDTDSPSFLVGNRHINPDGGIPVSFRGADIGNSQLGEGFRSTGSPDRWINGIQPVIHFPRVMLALCIAATPPLQRVLGVPNFAVELAESTSVGKTTVMHIAASAWGYPDETNNESIVLSWDGTRFALQDLATTTCDLPTFIDDTRKAPNMKLVKDTFYGLTGRNKHQGSLKGSRGGKTRHNVLMSTAESPSIHHIHDDGVKARTLTIRGKPLDKDDDETRALVDKINAVVMSNYGNFGPMFIEWLLKEKNDWPKLKQEYEERRSHYTASRGIEFRLADCAAALYIAGKLLHIASSFPWKFYDPLEQLWPQILVDSVSVPLEVRALIAVHDWAISNRTRFYGHHRLDQHNNPTQPIQGWVGQWKNTSDWEYMAFLPHMLKAELTHLGFDDFDAVLTGWANRDWLLTDGKGQKKLIKIDGKPARCIVIKRLAFGLAHEGEAEWPEILGTMDDWGCMACEKWLFVPDEARIKESPCPNAHPSSFNNLWCCSRQDGLKGTKCPDFLIIAKQEIQDLVEHRIAAGH